MPTWSKKARRSAAGWALLLRLHKIKSHKLMGFPGSIGEGSEHPEMNLETGRKRATSLTA